MLMKRTHQQDDICDACQALYEEVGDQARRSGLFDKVRRTDHVLLCRAREVESEAHYFVFVNDDHDHVYVGLHTPDRWLSESIEADLVHLGEKVEELLEEELIDQGIDEAFAVEHFRDDEKLYVFRSAVPVTGSAKLESEETAERITRILRAYEACFYELGDMAGEEPD